MVYCFETYDPAAKLALTVAPPSVAVPVTLANDALARCRRLFPEMHPQVAEAAVVGATDERGLAYCVAHVVLRGNVLGSEELAAEICEHVRARLVSYKVPREVRFCSELPKTVTGKIQRFKLRGNARE